MGNVIRRCCGEFSSSDAGAHHPGQYPGQYPGQFPSEYPSQYPGQYPGQHQGQHQGPYGPQGGGPVYPPAPPVVAANTAGFSLLARDLLEFETTNKVPDALSQYVKATKATQVSWYRKLLVAWKNARPPPTTAEEASALLLSTLQGHHNVHVQGLLRFYGLPTHVAFVVGGTWPQGVQYEIHTLPVEDRAVGDGDTITVYVDVHSGARETVPVGIMEAVHMRQTARAQHNYVYADALQKQIQQAGYKVFDGKDGGVQCVARKYRLRLKGVDAPESTQPYGQQSKACLSSLVQGHPLLVHVYTVDQYGRLVGDVHCNGIFIQEALLKKGCVWHYTQYDKRPTFAKWESEAKAARVGLWAFVNPERPWEYRKGKKDSRRNSPSIGS